MEVFIRHRVAHDQVADVLAHHGGYDKLRITGDWKTHDSEAAKTMDNLRLLSHDDTGSGGSQPLGAIGRTMVTKQRCVRSQVRPGNGSLLEYADCDQSPDDYLLNAPQGYRNER